ncbi:MAG: hypothetical protein L0228_08365 [Planctomycetes bacterium]|nr:hypothetical protein [Planctomycetota bacterium]
MMRHFLICAAALGALSFATAKSARADCGYGGGCDWGYGYGYLYNILRYEVPHFAAFPPVYYSYPVPRTYGYSPFAYPPHVMTPEIVGEVKPLEIINPHVDSTEAKPAKAKSDRSAATSARTEPLVVINPFVAANRAVAQVDR